MSEFVLDAYAARSCPVKTQNAHNPLIRPGEAAVDEGLAELFEGGVRFEGAVIAKLLGRFAGSTADLRSPSDDWAAREAACAEAMAAGVELIVDGVLPLDLAGHRSGRADLWLRGEDTADGRPGYVPVEIKHHRVQERRTSGRLNTHALSCSTLARPSFADAHVVDGVAFRTSSREADLIQLAHYRRLLEACGRAAGGPAVGAIIGTDPGPEGEPVLTWIDLGAKQIRTFSRTAADGWRLRSPLERYDHEHSFRVRVARQARQQTGEPGDPPLLVTPIVVRECAHCRWWEVCRPQLDETDLSLRIDKSPLDVREIAVLRTLGVTTVEQLAGVDLDELLPTYLPQVAHRGGAEDRLRLAHRRAGLMASGVELERLTDGPIALPEADVEIDFDIETAADDRVYLWGFLARADGAARYVPFAAFAHLDAAQELALAEQAMGWLKQLVDSARSVRVYHYSDYEVVRLRRLADESGSKVLAWAAEWAETNFVDLFTVVRANFFGTHGLGLKSVAHEGAGFTWRDDDPGGLNSQRWFTEAVDGATPEIRDAARQRVLEYNEDDVLATDALRSWLRGL